MSSTDRRERIIALLRREGRVRIGEMSKLFSVTAETLRRDLAALERKRVVKKIHGGAVLVDNNLIESSFHVRKVQQIEKKQLIAELAANFVHENDTVMLDASTTAFYVAENLAQRRRIMIITNSLQALNVLSHSTAKIIGLGGELDSAVCAFVGTKTLEQLNNLHATHSFISCHGIDTELHAMDISPEEASIKEALLRNSSTRYLLMDSSKFGKKGAVKIHGLEHIDFLITDCPPEPKWMDIFKRYKIEVVYPQ